MKHLILAPALVVALAIPVHAEDSDDGFSLMQEGAKLLFRGLMQEVEPALDELETLMRDMEPSLRAFAQEMGPGLRDLMDKVDDWTLYDAPEILPNGDIIIRRKAAPAEETDI